MNDGAQSLAEHAAFLFPLLIAILGSLVVTLSAVAAWIGRLVYSETVKIRETLEQIEKELRADLAHLDRRIVRLETLKGIDNDLRD